MSVGDGIGLVGLAVLGFGLFTLYQPIGWIYVGLVLVTTAYLLEVPRRAAAAETTENAS
jgi:hypothetical protein